MINEQRNGFDHWVLTWIAPTFTAPAIAIALTFASAAPALAQVAPKTLVAVFAHADDEGPAAPMLARYAREGARVYLIIATDGAQGGTHTSIPPGAELARVALELADTTPPGAGTRSARNSLRGIVTKVTSDTVMAQVELQAGPHRIVSLMSREAADELALEVGVVAYASIKATNVVVGLDDVRSTS